MITSRNAVTSSLRRTVVRSAACAPAGSHLARARLPRQPHLIPQPQAQTQSRSGVSSQSRGLATEAGLDTLIFSKKPHFDKILVANR